MIAQQNIQGHWSDLYAGRVDDIRTPGLDWYRLGRLGTRLSWLGRTTYSHNRDWRPLKHHGHMELMPSRPYKSRSAMDEMSGFTTLDSGRQQRSTYIAQT